MIDLHCHLLPKVDDGSDSVDTTLEMLKIGQRDGIEKIVATAHYNEFYNNSFYKVKSHVEAINSIIKENKIKIEVLPGQEVYLTSNILKCYDSGLVKGLNDSKYMLIELPMECYPKYAADIIYELKVMGITTIIAHPERYAYFINDLSNINLFIEKNCLFQINATSILGKSGKHVKRTAFELLNKGIADFIASDAHDKSFRKPQIKDAFNIIREIDSDLEKKLIENPYKVINNENIDDNREKIIIKRYLFGYKI